jgi:hypothetical protein
MPTLSPAHSETTLNANRDVIEADSKRMRQHPTGARTYVMKNLKMLTGLNTVVQLIMQKGMLAP